MPLRLHRYLLCTLLSFVTACAGIFPEPKQDDTLYQQLGGRPGLEKLVDVFIRRIADDDQVFPYFAKASVTHFRRGFITHLCDVAGGPCDYSGDTMQQIHTGMHIDEADFNRVVELLIESMEEINIPYTTQNRLLSRLAPLRDDIIHI